MLYQVSCILYSLLHFQPHVSALRIEMKALLEVIWMKYSTG